MEKTMPTNLLEEIALVKTETINKVLEYLSFKPYNEAAPMIQLLQNDSKVLSPEAAKEVTSLIVKLEMKNGK